MDSKPSKEYAILVSALDVCVGECIGVSQSCAGIKSPTAAHFYASLLFTSLCTRAISLVSLVPHSPWSQKRLENWDFASAAGLVRSILELRLTFYYLCIEKVERVEWECRWNTLNMHDCHSRQYLFQEMGNSAEHIEGFRKDQEELRARLEENQYFNALPPGRRKQILNGQVSLLAPLEAVAQKAGVDTKEFRILYKLFSSQIHGFPLSYYRMPEQNRGRGVHSESEEGYTSLCISSATKWLGGARLEMEQLFRDVRNA